MSRIPPAAPVAGVSDAGARPALGRVCSICGRSFPGSVSRTGPGGHEFHAACINGAQNFVAMTQELTGDRSPVQRMDRWINAELAGVAWPFPPFRDPAGTPRDPDIALMRLGQGTSATAKYPCPSCRRNLVANPVSLCAECQAG